MREAYVGVSRRSHSNPPHPSSATTLHAVLYPCGRTRGANAWVINEYRWDFVNGHSSNPGMHRCCVVATVFLKSPMKEEPPSSILRLGRIAADVLNR